MSQGPTVGDYAVLNGDSVDALVAKNAELYAQIVELQKEIDRLTSLLDTQSAPVAE